MADEDPGRELPQRVRGEARSGSSVPAPSPSPVLSEELRQRMRAAVTAERSGAATKQDEAPGSKTASPKPGRSARPKAPRREPPATPQPSATPQPPAAPEPPATPQPPATPEPHVRPVRAANAGPIPEDEITQRIEITAKPPSPVRRRAAGRSRTRRRTARFVAVILVIGVLAVAAVSYFGRSSATSPTSPTSAAARARRRRPALPPLPGWPSRSAGASRSPVTR